jgi:hypothetical protein
MAADSIRQRSDLDGWIDLLLEVLGWRACSCGYGRLEVRWSYVPLRGTAALCKLFFRFPRLFSWTANKVGQIRCRLVRWRGVPSGTAR